MSVTREDVAKEMHRVDRNAGRARYSWDEMDESYRDGCRRHADAVMWLAARLATLERERDALAARITALENGMFAAGRLYGFECPDGLPCWCEPEDHKGPHSKRCVDLRAVLTGVNEAPDA